MKRIWVTLAFLVAGSCASEGNARPEPIRFRCEHEALVWAILASGRITSGYHRSDAAARDADEKMRYWWARGGGCQ